MTNQLRTEIEKINQGCGKNLGAYMEIPKEYENASDKIRKEKSFSVEVICGKQELCPTCQAEISALKKGIYACEEILNSQQNKMTSNQGMVSNPNLTEVNRTTGSADTQLQDDKDIIEHYKKYGVVEGDKLLLETAKNNFKKGQEQRNKEILEIIDKWETKQPIDQKYKVEKKGIFYNIYNVSELNLQELKKQLTTEGEGK